MSEITESISNLLQTFIILVTNADYSDEHSITHLRVKVFYEIIHIILTISYYEQHIISKEEFNELDQRYCDIYNTYIAKRNNWSC